MKNSFGERIEEIVCQNNIMIPTHISIIMDGNGRWAELRSRERVYGHKAGVESVRDCCEYAAKRGVKYLSLFAFSQENWSRPEEEVNALMELMAASIVKEVHLFYDNQIRLKVIGDLSRLDKDLVSKIEKIEDATKDFSNLTVIIMLSYSGKWDLKQAAERYAIDYSDAISKGETPEPLTEELFASYLSTYGIPDPDLLIRTSGEQRISNYMLWQCAYTEFYFTETLWPDFRKEQFEEAIENFSKRERRYGKIK